MIGAYHKDKGVSLDAFSTGQIWDNCTKIVKYWDTWVAQSFKCPTLDFGSGHDLRVVRSSPALGSALGIESP